MNNTNDPGPGRRTLLLAGTTLRCWREGDGMILSRIDEKPDWLMDPSAQGYHH
jgi:hypothetical protein